MSPHKGLVPALLSIFTLIGTGDAAADSGSKFNAGGYMRIMARPDLQGGDGRLGYWNLYGRLLNEGPYASLDMRYDLLPQDPLSKNTWTSIHARIEGGSVLNADTGMGSLGNFRLSQLYAQAGNVLLQDVTWQIGTMETFFGDLGLYDFKVAQVLFDSVGISARYQNSLVDVLIGAGDAGFMIKGTDYNPIPTIGGTAKLKLGVAEIGVGGQFYFEPEVEGNRFAPHNSVYDDGTTIDYENFVRGEISRRYFEANPAEVGIFTEPIPTATTSWRGIGYIGFGGFGPLVWNNLFANIIKRHPQTSITETFNGEEFIFYVDDLTDERYELNIGNEMQLRLIEDVLDLTWAGFYGYHWDADDEIVASERNREVMSIVARFQGYFNEKAHLLLESSLARERSLNGNLFRNASDSVFVSTDGRNDTRGLEFGDSDTRDTFQIKVGPVLQPLGMGIFTRPSFRLLYGAQYSSQNNAFGNGFVESLDDFNVFGTRDVHWHHVVSAEVETWF